MTYETLWENPIPEIDLLITIGSPLAMPGVVFPRLRPEIIANRGARPPGVARWVNLALRTADLPRLLRLIAARHAGVLNVSDLAADAPLPRTSVLRYLDTLEALFLIVRIPPSSPTTATGTP